MTRWSVWMLAGLFMGCGSRQAPPAAPSAPVVDQPAIVFLGDSLTAGYGVDPDQAYPALIAEKLKAERLPYRVVNAGVSGDTTAGGVRRLEWILNSEVKLLVVALGANDGLRGLPLAESRKNLEAIVNAAVDRQIPVVVAGMKLPMNYGADYRRDFERLYPSVAKQFGATYLPFLLEGVAAVPALNQADGLHPNAEGQKRIAEHVWKTLRSIL